MTFEQWLTAVREHATLDYEQFDIRATCDCTFEHLFQLGRTPFEAYDWICYGGMLSLGEEL